MESTRTKNLGFLIIVLLALPSLQTDTLTQTQVLSALSQYLSVNRPTRHDFKVQIRNQKIKESNIQRISEKNIPKKKFLQNERNDSESDQKDNEQQSRIKRVFIIGFILIVALICAGFCLFLVFKIFRKFIITKKNKINIEPNKAIGQDACDNLDIRETEEMEINPRVSFFSKYKYSIKEKKRAKKKLEDEGHSYKDNENRLPSIHSKILQVQSRDRHHPSRLKNRFRKDQQNQGKTNSLNSQVIIGDQIQAEPVQPTIRLGMSTSFSNYKIQRSRKNKRFFEENQD